MLVLQFVVIGLFPLFCISVVARTLRMRYVRETPQWWHWTNVYYETRWSIMPMWVLSAANNFLRGDWFFGCWDLILIVLYRWMLNSDEDDPNDRWRKRGKKIRAWVTAPLQVLRPAPVGVR